MTTIGTNIGKAHNKGNTIMGYKRITCYWDFLEAEYIAPIEKEIERIKAHLEQSALTWGTIPYRVYDAEYHTDNYSRVIDAAMLTLHKDMKTISEPTWAKYVEVYKSIPTNQSVTWAQPGIKNVRFYDADSIGDPSMVQIAEEIIEYIDTFVKTTVPYLYSKGPSYKIAAALAIIHSGTKLKEKQQHDISSNEVS